MSVAATAANPPWWIRNLSACFPAWLVSLAVFVAAAAIAFFFHRAFMRMVRRFIGPDRIFVQSLISRAFGATRFALVAAAIALALPIVPLSPSTSVIIAEALAVCFTLLVGWAALVAIDLAGDFYIRRFRIDIDDNLLARKHVTQVRVLRRVADTVVIIITLAVALMTFPQVRQFGVSLIASAGAAGILVGLAARPVLTNMIAGVQIAITQPIEAVRQKLNEIVKASKLWDGRVVNLQVTEATQQAIQLRALASARTSQQVWDLRCEIREKLIAFLQENYPNALPRQRAEVHGANGEVLDFESFADRDDRSHSPPTPARQRQ